MVWWDERPVPPRLLRDLGLPQPNPLPPIIVPVVGEPFDPEVGWTTSTDPAW